MPWKRVAISPLSQAVQGGRRTLRTRQPPLVRIDALALERPQLLGTLDADGDDEDPVVAARNFFERCRHDGIFVVAVGVERPDQLRALEGQSVDAYQGWLARAERPATSLDRL